MQTLDSSRPRSPSEALALALAPEQAEAIEEVSAPDEPTRVYLAGPMRGIEDYNFPAFYRAAHDLRSRGFEVWSPAEADETLDGFDATKDEALPFLHYMKRDLPAVMASDLVVVLAGWHASTGARLEVHVAEECGIPVVRYPDLAPARHETSRRFHAKLRQLAETHDRKSADYGTDGDPFANVRSCETTLGIPAWVGVEIRVGDKTQRIGSFVQKGELANESLEDSILDRAVYSVIQLVLLEDYLEDVTPV